jgi:hypothetical protein
MMLVTRAMQPPLLRGMVGEVIVTVLVLLAGMLPVTRMPATLSQPEMAVV